MKNSRDQKFSTAYVPIRVNNRHFHALVDSGASVSICDKSILNINNILNTNTNVNVRGVTGANLEIIGSSYIDITIGDEIIGSEVYVVDKLHGNSFIMGRDILEARQCIINYKKLTFQIGKSTIPLFKISDNRKNSCNFKLLCCKTVHIKPYSDGIISCHLNTSTKHPSRTSQRVHLSITGAVESLNPSALSHSSSEKLIYEPSLVNVRDGKVNIKVVNVSEFPMTIYRQQHVAKLTTFSSKCVSSIAETSCPSANDQNLDSSNELLHSESKSKHQNQKRERWRNIDDLFQILGIHKLTHLSPEEMKKVKDLVSEFKDIFAENDSDMGKTDIMEQRITLDTDAPIRTPYYNIPMKLRPHAEKAVKDLMDLKIIEPSTSNYHSPSFLMKKPDGSGYRILTDYRLLNKHVIRSYQPLQGVQEMLSLWHGCKWYSKIDLQKGFYQTPIEPESRHVTATSIPGVAFFQYCASPLGLSSSPTFFQSLVEKIFMGLKQSVVVCYLDDALSGAPSFTDMCNNLRQIFSRIRDSKMLLNPKKCELFLQELRFLGYIINSKGLAVCPEKVASIEKMAPPTNIKGVRSFLGLTGFFRKFIQNYSKICEPLTRLTKKHAKFKWDSEEREAWQNIKDKLIKSPILIHPDLNNKFTLVTDASSFAIGGILAQKDDSDNLHPIAYGSTILNDNQRNWSVHQRELYALLYFCEKYQSFLDWKYSWL